MAGTDRLSTQPLPAALLHFTRQHRKPSHSWLAAVSGGPDSIALLHSLTSLRDQHGWHVHAGHVNHQLRGDLSEADEESVRDFCQSLHVTLHVEKIDVRAYSRSAGENLEATARRLRYTWLQRIAEAEKLAWIATGHHADDQAETVLHHLLRGTALRGLRGIASYRRLNIEVDLVRPLLSVTRRQILAHLQDHGLPFRQDHTNTDTDLMRNRIRHELLPLLCERFQTEVPAHLVQLAEQAREWQEFLSTQATILLRQVEKPRVGSLLILDQVALSATPPLMIREVFQLLWEREGWPRGELTASHWQRMAEVAKGDYAACEFPGGLLVSRHGHILQVGPKQLT